MKEKSMITIIIVSTVTLMLLVFFIFLFITENQRRKTVHQKEKKIIEFQFQQELLRTQLEIQEQTLRTISQEIHDNIGQVLSLAKLNLNTIPQTENSETIVLTEELLGKAINDLRDLSKSMHPEKIADIGLTNAIRNELLMMQRAAK